MNMTELSSAGYPPRHARRQEHSELCFYLYFAKEHTVAICKTSWQQRCCRWGGASRSRKLHQALTNCLFHMICTICTCNAWFPAFAAWCIHVSSVSTLTSCTAWHEAADRAVCPGSCVFACSLGAWLRTFMYTSLHAGACVTHNTVVLTT